MASTGEEIYSWMPSSRLAVDEEVIERTCRAFDIDPASTVRQPLADHHETHPRLSEDDLRTLFKCLAERRNKRTARKMVRLVERWKDGVSDNQTDAFEYESIAKSALDIDAPVRYSNGQNYAVTDEETEAYKDLYRVSQAFFSYNYEENTTVYRGIRDLSVAKLFAQALDNPTASKYVIDTSVVSNFTATKEISHGYSTGIVIEPPLPGTNAAMMTDHIFPTSDSEDEIHVAGGKLALPPDNVVHLGNYTNDERRIRTTSTGLRNAENLSYGYLEDVFTILEIMGENDIGVRSQDGRDKVDNWFSAYRTYATDGDLEKVRPLVEYIKKVDRHKSWSF